MPKMTWKKLSKIEKNVLNKLNMMDVSAIKIAKWKWFNIKQFSIKKRFLLCNKKKKFRDYISVYNAQNTICLNVITMLIWKKTQNV